MSIVRDILVRITADNSGLNKGLDAAKAGLKKFSLAAAAALGAAAAETIRDRGGRVRTVLAAAAVAAAMAARRTLRKSSGVARTS